MVEKIKKNIGIILLCFIISFIVLLFTSKNSFIYPINDWYDANAFFTVGKGIFKGVVPYRDVFEQKGLILYFIYGLGSLISYKTFYGVFIIEVLFFTVTLFYLGKIVCLFLDKKYNFIILPVMAVMLTTSVGFVHGGACEEFCFPMLVIPLYYYIYHFKVQKLSYKQLYLNGLMAGLILMMKYSILGFLFGFMAFIFFDFIFNEKNIKRAFISCLFFLLGMATPVVLCLVYLGINGAIKDFIEQYFIINITAYGSTKMSIFVKIFKLIRGFGGAIYGNGLIFVLYLLLPFAIYKLKGNKYFGFTLFINICLAIMGVYFGLLFYSYYVLPLFIYGIIPLIVICMYLNKLLKNGLLFKVVTVMIIITCGCLTYILANYRYMMFRSKDEFFQYKYTKYIEKFDNPTLLNYGYLDAGLYTTTGILPNTKFFELQNIDYDRFPDNIDSMKKNIENKEVMFVLYYSFKDLDEIMEDDAFIFDNYRLVFGEKVYAEYEYHYAFLFQVKE